MGGMDEESQKDKVAWCYDRDTDNKGKHFVLDPGFNWKPEESSEQWCCTNMPGYTDNLAAWFCMHWSLFSLLSGRPASREILQ